MTAIDLGVWHPGIVVEVLVFRTEDAPEGLLEDARSVVFSAFDGGFTEDDWDHALGGWHAVVADDGRVVAHASVVPRSLAIGERMLACGYVEGVGTDTARRGEGHASVAMREVNEIIRRDFEMGALSTEAHGFYERLGWERWGGPTYVRGAAGLVRTEDEDDGIMVLRFGRSAGVDLTAAISCDERNGDDW